MPQTRSRSPGGSARPTLVPIGRVAGRTERCSRAEKPTGAAEREGQLFCLETTEPGLRIVIDPIPNSTYLGS